MRNFLRAAGYGSVEAGKECGSPRWRQMGSDEYSLVAVVALRADADPVAVFARELNHVGAGVVAEKLLFQLQCRVLVFECSDLHAPSAAGFNRLDRKSVV